jgi:predicted RNase H-like HicB family nuclease
MSRRPYSHRMMIGRSAARGGRFSALAHRAVEGGYWAKVPAIPGCVTQAESLPQLRINLREAIIGCLDAQDHLAVLKARARNASKRTYSAAEVRARLCLPSKR